MIKYKWKNINNSLYLIRNLLGYKEKIKVKIYKPNVINLYKAKVIKIAPSLNI